MSARTLPALTAHEWIDEKPWKRGGSLWLRRCVRCDVITYPAGRLTAWLYPDGRYHASAQGETSCDA